MNLDDCDLPEVQRAVAYLNGQYRSCTRAMLWDALDALYEKWQFAESWPGLLAFLDRVYPESIFTGSSGDQGPRIVVLTRALGKAEAERDKAETECDKLKATYLALRQQREGTS